MESVTSQANPHWFMFFSDSSGSWGAGAVVRALASQLISHAFYVKLHLIAIK